MKSETKGQARNLRQNPKIAILALTLSSWVGYLASAKGATGCTDDTYLDLHYPAGLQITNLKLAATMAPGYVKAFNQHLGKPAEFRAEGAPDNTGLVWVPKEACGNHDVDLIIAFHGWRGFGKPGENVYLRDPSQKNIEKIAIRYLRETRNEKGEVVPLIRPVIIAAPMHDRGPHDTVFGPEYYDINQHIQLIKAAIAQAGLDVDFHRVSISTHSNSNCGKGGLLAAEGLDTSQYQLYFFGANDGTCSQVVNGVRRGTDFLTRDIPVVKKNHACLFHLWVSPLDDKASRSLKTQAGMNGSADVDARLTEQYKNTWVSSDHKFYSYQLFNKVAEKAHTHTTVPDDLFDEIFPRFFAPGGVTTECLPGVTSK